MTVREPEYSAQDRALLLADLYERRIPRGSHGLPLSDVTDPANNGAYVVDLPTTDFAAQALSREQEAYKKRYPDADLGSLLWRVSKRG